MRNWPSAGHTSTANSVSLLERVNSLDAAQRRWCDRAAMGAVSIVKADGRQQRLIADNLTDSACLTPERHAFPILVSVRKSLPLREHGVEVRGFSA